ncbi:MAG TPA: Fic/DOC family N-terminal domain-containing protein, partial [Actinomycetota bacterium]|nr:Fic/DOC family N-terminal domain-containing protein [Actinomycetota bacterium]
MSEASIALGRLDGEGRRLPNPQRLARPAIRAEAVSTSALEGTYTTLPRVMEAELMEDEAPREEREVLDYVRAAEAGFRLVRAGKPVSLNMIKHLHRRLMERDPHCPPHEKGEIRSRQNFIGSRANADIAQARFVPPPPGPALERAIRDWELWIHREGELPLLVRAAVGHYQFEALHPFVDGNGRIGRLVAVLMLLDEGALSVPLLNISPYLETRRAEYQEHLLTVSATGDFGPWVEFFAEAVRVQALEGLEKTTRLLALRDEMVLELRSRKVRGLAIQVAEDLVGNPVITPSFVRDTYSISYQSASSILQTLAAAGLVEPRTWRKNR